LAAARCRQLAEIVESAARGKWLRVAFDREVRRQRVIQTEARRERAALDEREDVTGATRCHVLPRVNGVGVRGIHRGLPLWGGPDGDARARVPAPAPEFVVIVLASRAPRRWHVGAARQLRVDG